MVHWAKPSPQPKWHLDRFSHFCTAHVRVSTLGHALTLKIAPSHLGFGSHLISGSFWVHATQLPKWHLDWFSCFCTAHCGQSLLPLLSPEVHLPMDGSGPSSNTWLLGHPRPQHKRHLNLFSWFCRAGYCDRLTDHAICSVTIGRICVRNTEIRPKNGCFGWVICLDLWTTCILVASRIRILFHRINAIVIFVFLLQV